MLQRESPAGCLDEGATGGNDESLAASHSGVVSEQALQGQEEDDPNKVANATRKGEMIEMNEMAKKRRI